MKIKGVFLAAILTAVLCFSGNLLAYSGDGDGSAESPYQISTIEDWQELMNTPGDWGSSFILTSDVNLAGITLTPVGNYPSAPFTGIFDGNDNIISNAVINQPGNNYVGLFGLVGSGGKIRNLGVENVNITGRDYVGGLVGWNSSGTLTGCYAAGSVSGTGNCVGGLVGNNIVGTITTCYATGSVSGTGAVGGLVGVNGDLSYGGGTITSCYAAGSVSGTGNCVGGLVGVNYGELTTCYSTGSVTETGNYVGGLVGYNDSGTLTSCYATGSVSGYQVVGGLVGWNIQGSVVTSCYATGSVSGNSSVGGLVGVNDGSGHIFSSFWDTETSGRATSAGGTGKTTLQMKTLSTFTNAGWDFNDTDGDPADWMMPSNDYPRLAWETVVATPTFSPDGGGYSSGQNVTITCATDGATIHYTTNGLNPIESDPVIVSGGSVAVSVNPATTLKARAFKIGSSQSGVKAATYRRPYYSGGTGEPNNPYQISSVADFLKFSATPADWTSSFILTADVNLAGVTLTPVGNFTGDFNGTGKIIKNAVISLFGHVGSGGQVKNLGVEDVNITGNWYVGGLVGYNDGTLTNCYATGSVSGTGNCVGGLVGSNYGTLTGCYATGSVTATGEYSYAGGLVGYNDHGSLTSCYATGSVTGTNEVGGLVGLNDSGTLTACYATGLVSGNSVLGGLVGGNYSDGTLSSCYATGSVTGGGGVGGLVGGNGGSITACYAIGSVSGTDYVGGLVGYNDGTLTNCYATGSVSGTNEVGGLVGMNFGSLTSCYATGSVTGGGGVGGLVGGNGGSITSCYAAGSVSGDSYVGGLVGANGLSYVGGGGTITSCYATGSVSGTGDCVGGLVGLNGSGTLTAACYATGLVSGNYYVGGLVGINNLGSLTTCYATGSVSGIGQNSDVGGLVGYNYQGKIIWCYSTGKPTGISNVGGLCGSKDTGNGYEDTGNFWDTNSSEIATSAMGMGKATSEMQTQSTFTDAGWDFVGETANGPNDIWKICNGTNYPKLAWQKPLSGDFVCPDGVEIYDLAALGDQWLVEEIPADLAPPAGDGIVNFADFAVFADQWCVSKDIYALNDFVEQWLKVGLRRCSADISPLPDGDGVVNMLDFAMFADNWLAGI